MSDISNEFSNVIELIIKSQQKAIRAVNSELIDLYWQIGAYISQRVENNGWGKSVVEKLAEYIQENAPGLKGFSDKNLWRMKQFYETYADHSKLSSLLREITWTHNLTIFSRCRTVEEREFYIKASQTENYSTRELNRQISASLFERTMIGKAKLSSAVRENKDPLPDTIRDSYIFDFLKLPESYSEKDLQRGLVKQMKNFILELGKDFLFISEEYRIQVGNSDFYIDLLFYHRELQCLVAFELKTEKFKPEYLGQLDFYLEALDRDVKKENENPSIGILICKDKDWEVVEYALSRSLSPTMVSEYKTKLPDKKYLRQKLQELFRNQESEE